MHVSCLNVRLWTRIRKCNQFCWWWEPKIIAVVLTIIIFCTSCRLQLFMYFPSRTKKQSERSSRRIRFHPRVEELHYHQEQEEQDKRKVKPDKTSVGLFNPIKFLNSIDQWRIDKFETEIWQNLHWPWLRGDIQWRMSGSLISKWTTKYYWVFIF